MKQNPVERLGFFYAENPIPIASRQVEARGARVRHKFTKVDKHEYEKDYAD